MNRCWRTLLLLAVNCGLSAGLAAQGGFTTVTGTITDPNGLKYACGTISAQLVTAGGPAPTLNGGGFTTQTSPVNLGCPTSPGTGAAGSFAMRLADSGVILPSNTVWRFTVNISPGFAPPAGTGPQSFSYTSAINCSTNTPATCTSNTIDISTQLSALAPVLSNISGGASALAFQNQGVPIGTPSTANCTTNLTCSIAAGTVSIAVTGTTGVSSVGLAVPPQFNVSGSPVTTSGTLQEGLQSEAPNTVFAGPTTNSVGGIFDGVSSASSAGLQTSLPLTIQPNTNHDLALFVVQADGGISQSSGVSMTGSGTWTSIITNGNQGAVFRQLLASQASFSATANLPTPTNWAGALILLTANGTPAIVQTANISGAVNDGATATFPGNTTAGNGIVVVLIGTPSNSNSVNARITDGQGNLYTPVALQQNGAGNVEIAAAWFSANTAGGTTDPVTFHVNSGPGVSGLFFAMEVSGLQTTSLQPGFRLLTPADLTNALGTSQRISTFSNTNLGADVNVSATTATTVATRTVTMPAAGCPCRAFINYSLYITTASSGVGYSFWVNDGSANLAGLNTGQSNGSSGGLTSASYGGWSTTTYANGAIVTFTLTTEGDHTYVVRAASQLAGSAPNSSFQIAIATSN